MRVQGLAPVLLVLGLAAPASAAPGSPHVELTPFAGITLFDDDFRFPATVSLEDRFYFGGRAGFFLSRWFGIEGALGFTNTREDTAGGRDVKFVHLSGALVVVPFAVPGGGPFAFVGVGSNRFDSDVSGDHSGTVLEFGGGWRFWMTDHLGLRLEARAAGCRPEGEDEFRLHEIQLGGGLTLAFGGGDELPATPTETVAVLDSDRDGVPDDRDRCVDTPSDCQVDEHGCSLDSDGDGVCNGRDRCPDTAPGLRVDQHGCPIEVLEKETELMDTGMIRLQNVNFETGKADLLPESYPVLDEVGKVLSRWPELRIEIGGHADSRGAAAYNQRLSEQRVLAVRDFLLSRFPQLEADQFTTRGYGESKPLVPNTSELNWAKNRRVEFVVLNQDVLRREVERRRMLERERR